MANRYDQVYENQPVSTYIPLPLDLMGKVLASKQGEYDQTKGALQKSLLENSIKSINEHDDYRNKYVKSFNDQAQALVNDPNVDFSTHDAKQKVANLVYQHANDPNLQVLARSIDNKKQTLEDLEAIKKEKGAYGYWNDPLLQEDKLKQSGINPYMDQQGNPIEYQRKTILRREDQFKPAEDIFKNIKDSGKIIAYASPNEAQTYISTGKKGWEGVSAQTIKNVADKNIDTFKDTEGGQDFLRKFNFDNHELLSQIPIDKVKQLQDQAVTNHLYKVGLAFVHNKETADADLKATSLLGKKYDEDKSINSLISQTIEGQTYNPIANDKNFQALKDEGVFKIGNNGEVKIDWTNLNKGGKESVNINGKSYNPVAEALPSGYSYAGPGQIKDVEGNIIKTKFSNAEDNQKQLAEQMKKMADVTGFKGDIKSDNYEVIASAYNILNKARLFGEQLSAPVAELESKKLTRNWELTTNLDPKNINNLVERPTLTEGDKLIVNERQTNSKGEMIKKGVIVSKNGTRTPFAVKSNSLEDSNYFDNIGNIGINSAKYQTGEIESKGKTQDGLNVIDSRNIPNVGNVTTVGNPRDKSQVQYRIVTDDGKQILLTNYGDLQKYLENEYYTKTPEGKADATELLSKNKQYKELEE